MSQKPNDQLLESLSALVDDEASELEVRRILKNVDNNPEMLERWQRYHLVGSLLRRETDIDLVYADGFVSGVAALVDQEPEVALGLAGTEASSLTEKRQAIRGSGAVWSWLGKSSIAASFAAAIVLGANFYQSQQGDLQNPAPLAHAETPVANQSVGNSVPQGFQLPHLEARTVGNVSAAPRYFDDARRLTVVPQADDITDAATQNMLNEMLIYHAERASANGGLGMMPFARVSKMQESR